MGATIPSTLLLTHCSDRKHELCTFAPWFQKPLRLFLLSFGELPRIPKLRVFFCPCSLMWSGAYAKRSHQQVLSSKGAIAVSKGPTVKDALDKGLRYEQNLGGLFMRLPPLSPHLHPRAVNILLTNVMRGGHGEVFLIWEGGLMFALCVLWAVMNMTRIVVPQGSPQHPEKVGHSQTTGLAVPLCCNW